MKLAKMVKQFRVDKPDKFKLSDFDPAETCGLDIEKASESDARGRSRTARRVAGEALRTKPLVGAGVFQAMDARQVRAIKHVMSGVNPQGLQVHALRRESEESTMISSGVSPRHCRSAGASESSTVAL